MKPEIFSPVAPSRKPEGAESESRLSGRNSFNELNARFTATQAELAALRAKLAAAEADIAGKQSVIEASKAAINGQVNDCLKVEDDLANFRATVADALAALRAKMDGESTSDVAAFANGTLYWLAEFDATIAKLGLQEQSK